MVRACLHNAPASPSESTSSAFGGGPVSVYSQRTHWRSALPTLAGPPSRSHASGQTSPQGKAVQQHCSRIEEPPTCSIPMPPARQVSDDRSFRAPGGGRPMRDQEGIRPTPISPRSSFRNASRF